MTIKRLKELVNALELNEGNQDAEVIVLGSSDASEFALEQLVWSHDAAEWQLITHPG